MFHRQNNLCHWQGNLLTRIYFKLKNRDELKNRFMYHNVSEHQLSDMESLRQAYVRLARLVTERVPESRELSIALTNLEQSMFWANAGISRNGGQNGNSPDNDIVGLPVPGSLS